MSQGVFLEKKSPWGNFGEYGSWGIFPQGKISCDEPYFARPSGMTSPLQGRVATMHSDPPMPPPLHRIDSGPRCDSGAGRRPFELGAVHVVIPGTLAFTILESDDVPFRPRDPVPRSEPAHLTWTAASSFSGPLPPSSQTLAPAQHVPDDAVGSSSELNRCARLTMLPPPRTLRRRQWPTRSGRISPLACTTGDTPRISVFAPSIPLCRMVTPTPSRNERAGMWNLLGGARERWRARDACERESCVQPCIPQIPTCSLARHH